MRGLLDRKMYISYVQNVKPQNVKVTRRGSEYIVQVVYEVRGNLAYNLDYVASFDKSVTLNRPGVD